MGLSARGPDDGMPGVAQMKVSGVRFQVSAIILEISDIETQNRK
jgi:hypothetical protein